MEGRFAETFGQPSSTKAQMGQDLPFEYLLVLAPSARRLSSVRLKLRPSNSSGTLAFNAGRLIHLTLALGAVVVRQVKQKTRHQGTTNHLIVQIIGSTPLKRICLMMCIRVRLRAGSAVMIVERLQTFSFAYWVPQIVVQGHEYARDQ